MHESPAIFRHEVRDGLAGVALVLLVLVAVLMSPIQRSSAPDSQRPPEGLPRNFALPASDSPRLPVTTWIMREDAIVTVRSEDDEEDEEPWGAMRQAYDTYDPSFSPSPGAAARNLAVPGRPAALHPLRC
jgi:Na+-transporting methylmalonyl-CoA/oxaloacetate decarboxylase gamma subunit